MVLALGCTDDRQRETDIIYGESDFITIAYSVENVSLTRGDEAKSYESAIDHAYLLFYPEDSDNETDRPIMTVRAEAVTDHPGTLIFKRPFDLNENTNYRLTAIANADFFHPEEYDSFQEYLDMFTSSENPEGNTLHLYHSSPIIYPETSFLPMSGKTEGNEYFHLTGNNGKYTAEATINFRRLVARIDICNNIDEGFSIESVAIVNWRDKADILNPDSQNGEIRGNLKLQTADEAGIRFTSVPDKDSSGKEYLEGALYCFPNTSESPEPGDEFATAVILKAYYEDDTTPSYYRVNIGADTAKGIIRHNTRYSLSIKSVKGRGSDTPEEAYSERNTLIEPFIPDQDVALVPLTDKHVKIDHDQRLIEIDGFAPEVFNSFIDIPFMLHIDASHGPDKTVDIGAESVDGLKWPLEGRISMSTAEDLYYCAESFKTKPSVYSKSTGGLIDASKLPEVLTLKNEDVFYISVGAMGPDDPAIIRDIWLYIGEITGSAKDYLTYRLIIKPRQVIIDDVVLTDETGTSWLIMDRNIQDVTKYAGIIRRNEDGGRPQAYHYSSWESMMIPFKFKSDDKSSAFYESAHEEYLGYFTDYSNLKTMTNDKTNKSSRNNWLTRYLYTGNMERTSPFYEEDNQADWIFPTMDVMELCRTKMRVSKMRMFLMSDVSAKSGKESIPICCYWPFYGNEANPNSIYTLGYSSSVNGTNPNSLILLYADKTEVNTFIPTATQLKNYIVLSRLVRPLTASELNTFKTEFLGYGSTPLKLTVCHPDTYPSAVFP